MLLRKYLYSFVVENTTKERREKGGGGKLNNNKNIFVISCGVGRFY